MCAKSAKLRKRCAACGLKSASDQWSRLAVPAPLKQALLLYTPADSWQQAALELLQLSITLDIFKLAADIKAGKVKIVE